MLTKEKLQIQLQHLQLSTQGRKDTEWVHAASPQSPSPSAGKEASQIKLKPQERGAKERTLFFQP